MEFYKAKPHSLEQELIKWQIPFSRSGREVDQYCFGSTYLQLNPNYRNIHYFICFSFSLYIYYIYIYIYFYIYIYIYAYIFIYILYIYTYAYSLFLFPSRPFSLFKQETTNHTWLYLSLSCCLSLSFSLILYISIVLSHSVSLSTFLSHLVSLSFSLILSLSSFYMDVLTARRLERMEPLTWRKEGITNHWAGPRGLRKSCCKVISVFNELGYIYIYLITCDP